MAAGAAAAVSAMATATTGYVATLMEGQTVSTVLWFLLKRAMMGVVSGVGYTFWSNCDVDMKNWNHKEGCDVKGLVEHSIVSFVMAVGSAAIEKTIVAPALNAIRAKLGAWWRFASDVLEIADTFTRVVLVDHTLPTTIGAAAARRHLTSDRFHPDYYLETTWNHGELFHVYGDCKVEDNCLSSLNYPNQHGNYEHCSVTLLKDVDIIRSNIDIEAGWDHLIMYWWGTQHYITSSNDVLLHMDKGDTITWDTDGSVGGSWQICFTTPETHAPVFWQDNRCVDKGYAEIAPNSYIQANHWGCCASCPGMHGVSKYDTCTTSCGCICQQVGRPNYAIDDLVVQYS